MKEFSVSENKDSERLNLSFRPRILRLHESSDKEFFDILIKDKACIVHDEIYGQLQELVKSQNPAKKIKQNEYANLIGTHLAGRNIHDYGVWVYYEWDRRIIHLLDEEEFIEVRTNRNRYKITKDEQEILKAKKIGIVGLSVGQSIALTMAMERTCGELRLADFDIAELSNLNRLRASVYSLGLNKTIIAAREISQIDPFIKVKIFNDGLHTSNMDDFFLDGGKLDLFIEVCDGLDIKIESRFKARELKIPVVMDTNDRGMLDVERFDLEPDRPILHGLAEGLDTINTKGLSNEDKVPYILKMIGADTISTRLKASMLEVEQTINTWPQLASSVTLGGALTTDISRRILLDQYHDSGRYYIDLEDLIKDKKIQKSQPFPQNYIGPPELSNTEMLKAIELFKPKTTNTIVAEEVLTEIVKAGILAPSGGNSQPWKFLYTSTGLFIFHDEHFSYSLLDFNNLGSYVGIGAVIENISIKALALGFEITCDYFPVNDNKKIVAHIAFKQSETSAIAKRLERGITMRVTNRDLAKRQVISRDFYDLLQSSIASYQGAELHVIDNETLMKELGEILAKAEMLRTIHPRGHYDTFTNELRWTKEEIQKKGDGLDVNSLGATKSELAGFGIAGDTAAISFLRKIRGGTAFSKMVKKAVAVSSALGIITMPKYSKLDFLLGGRAIERIWIETNLAGVSCQPVSQLIFLLARLSHGGDNEFEGYFKEELENLNERFYRLLPQLIDKEPIFVFRFDKAEQPKVRSLRRPIESLYFYSPNT